MKANLYHMSGLLCALLTGCTGMHLDDGDMRIYTQENAAIEADYQSRVTLIQINASMIVAQAIRREETASPAQNQAIISLPAHEYQVGPQDVLQVTVWDHPELTTPAGQYRTAADSGNLVRQDGTTFYPYIGVVSVAGKTLEEIRQLFARELARYIENPQVDVRVAAYRSQKVYVTGEVAQPGMQPITDMPLHVLEAIQRAGGGRSTGGQNPIEADLEHVKLTRNGKMHNINVQAMLLDGDLSSNILLRDGDVLHVPDNYRNKVFVMGEVMSPRTLLIHRGHMSLAEALSDVGGVNPATSDASQIYIIRGGELVSGAATESPVHLVASFKPTIYQLDADSADALILADQFNLQVHDVIFVSAAPIVRWGRVLNQMQATLQSFALMNALMRR